VNPVWYLILVVYTSRGEKHPQWPDPIGFKKVDDIKASKSFVDTFLVIRKRHDTTYATYLWDHSKEKYLLEEYILLEHSPPKYIPLPELIIDTSGEPFIESYPLTEEGLLMASDRAFPVSESLLPKCNPKYEPTHPPQEPEPGRVRLRSL
jgi:hypothetical protein